MKTAKKQFWTFRYAVINILYFMSFCTVHQFASVFLLDKGFNNTTIGIILALANILSAVFQPLIAGLIDKPGRFTNRNVSIFSSALVMLGCILLILANDIKVIIFIVFALIYMIQFVYQPVLTALSFEYQKAGCNINYGLARGLGSAGFAVFSVFMGSFVERKGTVMLLISTIILMLAIITIIYFFKKPDSLEESNSISGESDSAHNNIVDFAKQYPMFVLFLLAVACFFFGHNMLNDYLVQIIYGLGGTETEFGNAIFLAALVELPAMAVMSLIVKKISPNKLLIMSGFFFLIKILIMLMANGMVLMYISQAFQLLSYAVFIPASAFYVEEIMQAKDKVKGQAFITSAITFSGVFSGPVCGAVLDRYGVSTMLIIGSIVTAVGILIAIKAIAKEK